MQYFCTTQRLQSYDSTEPSTSADADAEAVTAVPWFIVVMLFAAFLDVIDGPLARMLQQTSTFGIFVDIVADNIWRTAGWIAAVVANPNYAWLGLLVVSMEWLTFFASQVCMGTHLYHAQRVVQHGWWKIWC